MTLSFQKQEVGSWKLEFGFSQLRSLEGKRLVDLGTEKAPGTKLAKSNFQVPTSYFLFLKTEGHVDRKNTRLEGFIDAADSRRHDPQFSETGSWKLEVGSSI